MQYLLSEEFERNGVSVADASLEKMMASFLKKIGEPAVIIIDEFDSPFTSNFLPDESQNSYLLQMFNAFYEAIMNCQESIRFLFVTGITKPKGLDLFSGKYDLLRDLTLEPDFAGLFGYSQEELEENFAEHIDDYLASPTREYDSKNAFLEKFEDYYRGYRFSPSSASRVYNPVAVGKFFTSGRGFSPFWHETGSPAMAVTLVRINNLLSLITGDVSVALDAFRSFDIPPLFRGEADRDSTIAMLFHAGYLSFDGYEGGLAKLGFPNREVRESFTKALASKYMGQSGLMMVSDLIIAVSEGDSERVKAVLEDFISHFPRDIPDEEKEETWQALFHGMFVCASRGAGTPRLACDDNTVLAGDHAYYFEMNVGETADAAHARIHEKGCYKKHLGSVKTIHLLGLNVPMDGNGEVEWSEEEILS